jgi:hypothetical protein
MENLLVARLAAADGACRDRLYVYLRELSVFFSLPKYSLPWLAAWALPIVILFGSTFFQIFIYRRITGIVNLSHDTSLAFAIVAMHLIAIRNQLLCSVES